METLEQQIEVYKKNIANQQETLKALEAKLEKLKQGNTEQWKPKYGEKYFYISGQGFVDNGQWSDHPIDKNRFVLGNVFRTKEEADFAVERLKVIAELKEYSSEFDVDTVNYCVEYDTCNQEIYIDFTSTYKHSSLCFSSRKTAEQAIEAIGENRIKKYYLGVE